MSGKNNSILLPIGRRNLSRIALFERGVALPKNSTMGVWVFGCWLFLAGWVSAGPFRGSHQLIIHEIAWMGTSYSADQVWIELYNPGDQSVSMDGWKLRCRERRFVIELEGTVAPGDSFLLIREEYPELPGIQADMTFAGEWCDDQVRLLLTDRRGRLVDSVDRWYAGDPETHATMQRVYPYRAGYASGSWDTSTVRYDVGYGTPGFRDATRQTDQRIHAIYHAPDSINVYFNQPGLTEFASTGNEANHQVNLEERILDRLRRATHTIDITVYELNLPDLTDMLIRKAAEGVRVRVIADSKEPNPDDAERLARWQDARMQLERLMRGRDGVLGTDDDVIVFANAPIFAFDADSERRREMGLPARPRDIPITEIFFGAIPRSGRVLVEGEKRADGSYYRPGAQMHNKFILVDNRWLWTGSMNFTLTDLYGSEWARQRSLLRGNSNNGVEIHSPELVEIYLRQFEEMWGSSEDQPNPSNARFSGRKSGGDVPHQATVGDVEIDVFFSPGYQVVPGITQFVEDHAEEKVYFAIFAWSDFHLDRTLKVKWEGDDRDMKGERTGFQVSGLTEFWDDWWSAAINMTGRTPDQYSDLNPNIRWRHHPPVFRPNEVRRMHHKYMIVDADTPHDPTVIAGSANWSNNANAINDENTLFIRCDRVANQYVQDFYGMIQRAGGDLPSPSER